MALQSVYVALHLEVMRAALGFALNHPISCLENHQDVSLRPLLYLPSLCLLPPLCHLPPESTRHQEGGHVWEAFQLHAEERQG